jgi:hypothetical protein
VCVEMQGVEIVTLISGLCCVGLISHICVVAGATVNYKPVLKPATV